MVKLIKILRVSLVFPLIQGCGIALMYNGTIQFEDTRLYARYTALPVVTYPADSVSFGQVGVVYFDCWLGRTVETHDNNAPGYLNDAQSWSGAPPYVAGVSSTYRLIRTPDVVENPRTRIVSSVPLDSIHFFEKDRAETEKCNQYFPAVLEAALKPYNKDVPINPSPTGENMIGSLQELENSEFDGSIYDFPGSGSVKTNLARKYIMIITLYNIMNRYWTAGSKAHHSMKLNLYIVDRNTGRIVKIKYLEFLLNLDMKPIKSYPTVADFRESKMYKFYSLAIKELMAQSFVETK